jgi:hypothetical protein
MPRWALAIDHLRCSEGSVKPDDFHPGHLTGCGKTPSEGSSVTGHDFSRAEKTAKSTWALAPESASVIDSTAILPFSAAI